MLYAELVLFPEAACKKKFSVKLQKIHRETLVPGFLY